jgi:hypothetical protein
MKNLYALVLILAFPLILLAQNIHGIWSGTLINDSTHRTQNFELGLSEYRGKITGYTYTTFIENDTFYYSVKRIKAERKDGKLVIEDVEMVGNNFPQKAAKHVRQITTFPLINDTTIDIAHGQWSTNQTKKYYSIGGSAAIKEQEEDKESDLLTHLQEMKVKTDIAVNKKEKTEDKSIAKNQPVTKNSSNKQQPTATKQNELVRNPKTVNPQQNTGQPIDIKQADVTVASEINGGQKSDEARQPGEDKKTNILTNTSPENKENKTTPNPKQEIVINNKPVVQQNAPVNENKNTATVSAPTSQIKAAEQKQSVVQPVVSKTNQQTNTVGEEKKVASMVTVTTPTSVKKETIASVKELPSAVSERKNETIQELYFKNDSLVLSLYDNGIVDGDTVSVFVNGENVIAKQKLKEAATKKTIYISPRIDSVQLVLFAENLGSIPPNTGLLTVRDGDEVYQVRFSADLSKNASIFLRRKKDQ